MSEALEARVRQLELDLIEERHRRETLEKSVEAGLAKSKRELSLNMVFVALWLVGLTVAAMFAGHVILQLKERALIF